MTSLLISAALVAALGGTLLTTHLMGARALPPVPRPATSPTGDQSPPQAAGEVLINAQFCHASLQEALALAMLTSGQNLAIDPSVTKPRFIDVILDHTPSDQAFALIAQAAKLRVVNRGDRPLVLPGDDPGQLHPAPREGFAPGGVTPTPSQLVAGAQADAFLRDGPRSFRLMIGRLDMLQTIMRLMHATVVVHQDVLSAGNESMTVVLPGHLQRAAGPSGRAWLLARSGLPPGRAADPCGHAGRVLNRPASDRIVRRPCCGGSPRPALTVTRPGIRSSRASASR